MEINKAQIIIKEFASKAFKQIGKTILLYIVCIGYLVWWAGFNKFVYLMIGITAASVVYFVFTFVYKIKKFKDNFDLLNPKIQKEISDEFYNKHTICKLFKGEVHLLSEYIVYRSGSDFSILPIYDIEKIKFFKPSKTYGLSACLTVTLNNEKNYGFEFFGKHQNEYNILIKWITDRNKNIEFEKI